MPEQPRDELGRFSTTRRIPNLPIWTVADLAEPAVVNVEPLGHNDTEIQLQHEGGRIVGATIPFEMPDHFSDGTHSAVLSLKDTGSRFRLDGIVEGEPDPLRVWQVSKGSLLTTLNRRGQDDVKLWLVELVRTWSMGGYFRFNWYGDKMPEETVTLVVDLIMEMVNASHSACEVCNKWHEPEEEHHTCGVCGNERNGSAVEEVEIYGDNPEDIEDVLICEECLMNNGFFTTLNIMTCGDCGNYQRIDLAPDVNAYGHYCWRCFQDRFQMCESGDHYVYSDDYFWDMEECYSCYDLSNPAGLINAWDYRPELIFHPEPPINDPFYIGMELEMTWPDTNRRTQGTWLGKLDPDLLYAKSDSSVSSGFEVVTHPMQPRWALKNFPFELFDEAIGLGAYKTHRSTGTHIHMNKEAFTASLMWKLLQVHFRLPEFCGIVGGRGTDAEFGRLKEGGARGVNAQRRDLMEIVKKKGGVADYERYVALNLRNEYTIEMRYMRGGIEPYEIKKNMEWAQALYDFIRRISIADVQDGAIDDAGFILQFIYDGDYPNLATWLSKQMPRPKRLKERAQ